MSYGGFASPLDRQQPKKMVRVTITAADPRGGVNYVREKGKPPETLANGQTYEVDEMFALGLIRSQRAVLATVDDPIESRPLTTQALSADPVAQTQGAPATRKR